MSKDEEKVRESKAELVSRLVEAAGAFGEADYYEGKRSDTRYHDGILLEVTMDQSKPAAAWGVTMHNVSEGGLAFWSKKDLDVGTPMSVREFGTDGPGEWIAAQVTHRMRGLRGHLIGIQFE